MILYFYTWVCIVFVCIYHRVMNYQEPSCHLLFLRLSLHIDTQNQFNRRRLLLPRHEAPGLWVFLTLSQQKHRAFSCHAGLHQHLSRRQNDDNAFPIFFPQRPSGRKHHWHLARGSIKNRLISGFELRVLAEVPIAPARVLRVPAVSPRQCLQPNGFCIHVSF